MQAKCKGCRLSARVAGWALRGARLDAELRDKTLEHLLVGTLVKVRCRVKVRSRIGLELGLGLG